MKAFETIENIEVSEEFRVCPNCGYDLGFHTSLLKEKIHYKIILICPTCGARYDVGWTIDL
jgi:uncharacterized Zn finger protein